MNILFLFGGGAWGIDAAVLGSDYTKRLERTEKVSVQLISSKEKDATRRRLDESAKMLGTLTSSDFVIVFDERGGRLTSEKFSHMLEQAASNSMRAVCIVGGAYGINDDVRNHANVIVSLSDMIFPHDLARIMVLEQAYRARTITHGSKYHHAG